MKAGTRKPTAKVTKTAKKTAVRKPTKKAAVRRTAKKALPKATSSKARGKMTERTATKPAPKAGKRARTTRAIATAAPAPRRKTSAARPKATATPQVKVQRNKAPRPANIPFEPRFEVVPGSPDIVPAPPSPRPSPTFDPTPDTNVPPRGQTAFDRNAQSERVAANKASRARIGSRRKH